MTVVAAQAANPVAAETTKPTTTKAAAPESNKLAAGFGALVSVIGLMVLTGWVTGIDVLKSVIPGLIIMLPNTGICFLACGISIFLLRHEPDSAGNSSSRGRTAGRILAAGVLVIASAMLYQRLAGVSFPISSALFHDALVSYPYRPLGVFASNTAVCLISISLGLLTLDIRSLGKLNVSELFGLFGALISFTALLGYVYGVTVLYTVDQQAAMAFSTALGLASASLGLLVARPRSGSVSLAIGKRPSAILTRRLLIATMIIPVVLGRGWLELRRQNLASREVAVSIFVVVVVAVFLMVIIWTAVAMRRAELVREEALLDAHETRRLAIAARESAENANRVKSEFLAVMSHELRTPLNAIRGYTELLEMEIAGPLTSEQKANVARIRRSDQHLLTLIDDLLSFTHIDAGRIEYRLSSIPVVSLKERLSVLLDPIMRSKPLAFDIEIDMSSRVQIHADPDKTIQILTNLLMNAVKFTPRGGSVAVTCETTEHGGKKLVLVKVSDNGRGIPADKVDVIFEPFVQVEKGLTRTTEGVGLGLAISRSLARDMDGDLTVETEIGKGSVFTLSLPRAEDLPGDKPSPSRIEPAISRPPE